MAKLILSGKGTRVCNSPLASAGDMLLSVFFTPGSGCQSFLKTCHLNARISGAALPRPAVYVCYLADVHLFAKDGLQQMPFLPFE
jgi:hypothetical protein